MPGSPFLQQMGPIQAFLSSTVVYFFKMDCSITFMESKQAQKQCSQASRALLVICDQMGPGSTILWPRERIFQVWQCCRSPEIYLPDLKGSSYVRFHLRSCCNSAIKLTFWFTNISSSFSLSLFSLPFFLPFISFDGGI